MNIIQMKNMKLGPVQRALVNEILDDVAENPEAAAWTISTLLGTLQEIESLFADDEVIPEEKLHQIYIYVKAILDAAR